MSGTVKINNELDNMIAQAIAAEQDKQPVKTRTKAFSTATIMNALNISRQKFNRLRQNPENFSIQDLIKLAIILKVDRLRLYKVVDMIASENLNLEPMLPPNPELMELSSFDKEQINLMAELSQQEIKKLQGQSDPERLTKLVKLHQKLLMQKDLS